MNQWPMIALTWFSLFAPCSTQATDVVYKNSLKLYAIHDVEQGKPSSVYLDQPVGCFVADAGAVIYVKGQALYLIRNTRNPQPEFLDRPVGVIDMNGGVIAYIKGHSLYVRRLTDDAHTMSRIVPNAENCSDFDVKQGKVVFIQNMRTIFHVTNFDNGASVQIAAPAGEAQISK